RWGDALTHELERSAHQVPVGHPARIPVADMHVDDARTGRECETQGIDIVQWTFELHEVSTARQAHVANAVGATLDPTGPCTVHLHEIRSPVRLGSRQRDPDGIQRAHSQYDAQPAGGDAYIGSLHVSAIRGAPGWGKQLGAQLIDERGGRGALSTY